MTSGHVFIATSLDGFVARSDGAVDWLEPYQGGGEDYGYGRFMASIDGLIMGRGTFETVRGFGAWPYERPVIVLSRSLGAADLDPALRGKVEIQADAPEDALKRAADKGWSRAYVDGGRLVQAFLAADLIEEMIVTRVPILLGRGRPLFGALDRALAFTHKETASWPIGLVQSRYARARG